MKGQLDRRIDRQNRQRDKHTYRCYANLMFWMSGKGFCLVIEVDGQNEIRIKRRTDGQKSRQTEMNIQTEGDNKKKGRHTK